MGQLHYERKLNTYYHSDSSFAILPKYLDRLYFSGRNGIISDKLRARSHAAVAQLVERRFRKA